MKHYSTYQSQFIEMFEEDRFSKYRLGNLVSIRTGKLDANASSENGEYPFFTCGVDTLKIDKYAFDCEAVLLAGNGDFCVKYYSGKFNAYQRTYVIETLDSTALSVPYLYAWLRQYANELREKAIGGIIKYIKMGDLTEALIPLPSLEEQNRYEAIAQQADKSKFSSLKSQFIEMFGDVAETRSLCEICRPKQWPTIPTKDFTEDGYLVYGANGVIGHYSEYNHEHPTILMACRGASCGAINISQPNSYITGNAMCMDEVIPEISFEYLAYFLSNYDYKTIITGGAQPQITYANLKKVMVPIPSYNEQQSFALIYNQADKSKLIQNNTLLNNKLKFCYCYTPRHISS